MKIEITGKIIEIFPTETRGKFTVKPFVVEYDEEINGRTYSQFYKMTVPGNKMDILDNFRVGANVKCNCNLKGSKWEKNGINNYFLNLECWKMTGQN